jgi:cytidine deaminase
MKIRKIQLSITEYDSIGELLPADRELMQHAGDATARAYAPYSHYHVGAAVRLSNGKIFTAGNQENAAYPSGLCAERIAMFSAKSAHPDAAITDLAIAARSSDFTISEAVTPCGACRQVMAEYQSQQKEKMRIIMRGEKGPVLVATLDDLLPLMFHAEELKKKH